MEVEPLAQQGSLRDPNISEDIRSLIFHTITFS